VPLLSSPQIQKLKKAIQASERIRFGSHPLQDSVQQLFMVGPRKAA
jgi:hypothetical protein